MAVAHTLDPSTQNENIGLYISRSRRVVVDTTFGQLATWVKAQTTGDVVWENSISGEQGIWHLESGETAPLICDKILTNATIDGILETTSASGMLWGCSGASLKG